MKKAVIMEDLDKKFWQHVDEGNKMSPQTADNMLIAYGFFKQATLGDNLNERPTESSNVIETFKHDAWKRLEGMPQNEAKEKYIQIIHEMITKQQSAAAQKAKRR